MRSKVLLETRTYPLASLWTTFIYLWTLGSVAHSLQDGCLSCVGSSDNEDPKLEVWDLRKTLLVLTGTLLVLKGALLVLRGALLVLRRALLVLRRTLLDSGETVADSVTTQICAHSIEVSQDSKLAKGWNMVVFDNHDDYTIISHGNRPSVSGRGPSRDCFNFELNPTLCLSSRRYSSIG